MVQARQSWQGPHKRAHVGGVVLEQQAAQRVVLEARCAAPGARRHRQAVVVHRRAQHTVQAVLLHACAEGPTGHGRHLGKEELAQRFYKMQDNTLLRARKANACTMQTLSM